MSSLASLFSARDGMSGNTYAAKSPKSDILGQQGRMLFSNVGAREMKMFPQQVKCAKMNERLIARRKVVDVKTKCEEASDTREARAGGQNG